MRHVDEVMACAADVFGANEGVVLEAKMPGVHWCRTSSSHAAETSAGYPFCGFAEEEQEVFALGKRATNVGGGYEPVLRVLAKHGARVSMNNADLSTSEHAGMSGGFQPDELLAEQVAAATTVGCTVALENSNVLRFDKARPAADIARHLDYEPSFLELSPLSSATM